MSDPSTIGNNMLAQYKAHGVDTSKISPTGDVTRYGNITIGIAVCLAESGGNDSAIAYNFRTRDGKNGAGDTLPAGATLLSTDRGPWQINDKAHPEVSTAQALSIGTATRAAYGISSGFTNWSAWSTYKNGAYKQTLPAALAAMPAVTSGLAGPTGLQSAAIGVSDAASSATSAWKAITGFIGKLSSAAMWIRLAEVAGGVALTLLGLALLSRGLVENVVGGAVSGVIGNVAGQIQSQIGAS